VDVDTPDRDARVEARHEMDQEHAERAAADDNHRLAATRGRFVHGVQADGERIGERRFLEGDVAWDREAGALVRPHSRRSATEQCAPKDVSRTRLRSP
jgi:hypothetical protein